MSTKFWQRVFSALLLAGMILGNVSPASVQAGVQATQDSKPLSLQTSGDNFDVSDPVTPKISPPLRDLQQAKGVEGEKILSREINPLRGNQNLAGADTKIQDPLAANGLNQGRTPSPLLTFEGVGDLNLYTPPDTNGDVGPNHYVQIVNVKLAVYSKAGVLMYGPVDNNTLWAGFGGPCQNDNDGDPIVLYDDMADRWMISQFAVTTGQEQCVAVSTSPDPLGTYYLYDFPMPDFPDYPKFGIWPDGYYLGTNTGFPNQYYAHVFDRVSMLAGLPATRQSFSGYANLLMPADADGLIPPPAGAPEYFYTNFSAGYPNHPPGVDRLAIYEFDVDWAVPANSTFTLVTEIPIAAYNYTVCGFFGPDCIPEPAPGVGLDSLSWWPMVRLQYRNFGSYEAMVGNFTVDPDGTDKSAIRWFELRKASANPWSLFQEGTYAPDSSYRWMGSIAMDGSGNIALGYSVSDSTVTKPSIRYAVHQNGDPLGTMQAEATVINGNGVNTGPYGRWGDYSAMSVDPADQCTFWITNEYHDVNESSFMWNTRVGAFKVPECTGGLGPQGELSGLVDDGATGIPGADVQASLSPTMTFNTTTLASGLYTMNIPVGTYTVTASAYGYLPSTVTGVDIISGTVTTQNFSLAPATTHTVSGVVTDAVTGWPLYAQITIDGYPGAPIWNDPVTGSYSINLTEGITYTFNVDAWVAGYTPESRDVGPLTADDVEDFALDVDIGACSAPGYYFGGAAYYEGFEADNGGYTTSGTTSFAWGNPTSGPGAAHSGANVWATNLGGNYNNSENGAITSPNIDLSAYAGQSFSFNWWQWLQSESGYDYASVDVSNNGGTTWTRVYGEVSGTIDTAWTKHIAILDSSYAVSNFRARFNFRSDSSVAYPGWYIDDVYLLPMPPPVAAYNQNFDAGNGGFTVSGATTSWAWGAPTSGPGAPHSAPNVWATNLSGDYSISEDGYITSPAIDLSAYTGQSFLVKWWQWLRTEGGFDYASMEVSNNGGSTWTRVYGEVSGSIDLAWAQKTVSIDSSYAVNNFMMRFRFRSDTSVNYPGWYVDDIEIDAIDAPTDLACLHPADGGLVVGNVYDANTLAALNGASVANDSGNSTTAVATPADLAVDDAFFTLFSPSGTHFFTATIGGGYGPDVDLVSVVMSDTVYHEFDLPAGMLDYAPPALEVTLPLGAVDTIPLTLTNFGGLPVNWGLIEQDGGYNPPPAQVYASSARRRVELSLSGSPRDPNAPVQSWTPSGPVALALDDGTAEDSIGLTAGGQIVWFNRFTPDPGLFSFTLDTVSVLFNTTVAVGDNLQLVIWEDTDGDGDPGTGANFLYSQDVTVQFNDLATWNNYTLATPVVLNGPGDVLVGVVNRSGATGYLDYPAAIDQGPSQLRSWLGSYAAGNPPNPPTLPADSNWGIIDSFGLPGNWTLRASGFTGGGGDVVPWLSESPITGTLPGFTVPPAPSQVVDVTFDASVVTQPGTYLAFLKINNDTPLGDLTVPVTMTVVATPDLAKIQGEVTGLGYCDVNPVPLEGLNVVIEGFTRTFTVTTDVAGDYSLWLNADESPVIISADGNSQGYGFGIQGPITITAGITTTVNFDLRWLEPCVSVVPPALDVDVAIGFDKTEVLDLANNGAVSANWSVVEVGSGMLKLALDELVQDGGFEAGTPSPYWVEHSTNFGTPICDVATCGTGGGTAGPRTGSFWAWFGGIAAYEEGWVSQDITIPPGLASLTFYLWVGTTGTPAADYFDARIDGNVVFHATGADNPTYPAYTLVTVDVSAYADGASHTVEFYSECQGSATTNFNLDDISLTVTPAEVPWLAEDPTTGIIPHDNSSPMTVTFTAFQTMTVGVAYTASLIVKSDDPVNSNIVVPVTMHVVEPAYGVAISPDDSLTGIPGETVVYAVTITNTGNGPVDSYDVSLGASVWTSVLDVTEVGPLGSGESAVVHVSVTVPDDVVLPDHDTLQVTATSQGDATQTAISTLTTVAGGIFGVDLEPEVSAASGGPGDVITYTLRLTNTGALTDTINVSVAGAGAAWTTLPQDTFVLAGGEAVDVLVVVTIPAGAVTGDYLVTVTAASMHDPTQTDDVAITTSVTQSVIYLPLIWRAPAP